MRKIIQQEHYSCSVQKTAPKNNKYSRNERIFKIGHFAKTIAHAKAIAFVKCSVCVKTLKCQKHAKNHSTRTLQLFCAKNRTKKHQIFEKWDNFQNRPSWKGYSQWKGYRLSKMVSLAQKLKMPKTCEKPFNKNITVVVCKKPHQKTPNIREMRQLWKSAKGCKGYI